MGYTTYVKGHYSHSRSGEEIWVPRHRMRPNEKVHEHHLERVKVMEEVLHKERERT